MPNSFEHGWDAKRIKPYNRHRTFKFVFGCVLASIIALSAIYFPVHWVWNELGPSDFWQRALALLAAGLIGLLCFVSAIFIWIFIASRFE